MRCKNKIYLLALCCLLFVVLFSTDAYADIFETLRQRTVSFSIQLRALAYGISCFGIIMFTFLAISGKINFKHLGYIFISLFMLSATGALIDYFGGNEQGHSLKADFNDTYEKAVCSSSLCR